MFEDGFTWPNDENHIIMSYVREFMQFKGINISGTVR